MSKELNVDPAVAVAATDAFVAFSEDGTPLEVPASLLATAVQGAKADTAVQPGDLGTAAYTAATAYDPAGSAAAAQAASQPVDAVLTATTASFTVADETKLDGIAENATDDTNLAEHLADDASAHPASAVAIVDAGLLYTATDVEGALAEVMGVANAGGGGGITLEEVQDDLGTTSLLAGTSLTKVYDDVANTITLDVDAADFATAAQGTTADTALQPAAIGVTVQGYSAVLAATTEAFTTADGTKLDGIETAATADQTAAEILAKLVTVDGAGSGLDADLLDGVSSAGYATSAQGTLATNAVPKSAVPVTLTIAVGDETTAITTGNGKVSFRMPHAMTLTGVRASLVTASSSGIPTFDINLNGVSILSTKLTIDASETTSTTAATAVVISTSALTDDGLIAFDIDVAGTAAAGPKITLIGTRSV